MTSTASSPPTSRGLLDELFLGRVRWDLLRPFPEQDEEDRLIGDAAVTSARYLLRDHLDPAELDRTGELPDSLVEVLRKNGYFGLMIEPGMGGLGLSPMNALRVMQVVASWSPAISWMLAITNGLGAGAYLPLLADGSLRDLVTDNIRSASLGGSADSEVSGAANRGRATTAVPVEGGAAYLISGEKLFIGNGVNAELLDVSATVVHDGVEQIRVFFVETDAPGVEVVSRQEFMGLRGAPIGVVRFENVRVPAEQLLPASADEWRDEPELVRLALLGRMLIIASPSLAIAKLCLSWSKDFVNRRTMDDRPLADYDEIQRIVAQTAADVFAIESVVEWSMLSGDLAELTPELTVAKNLTSVACCRVVDRTLSLMAGEGLETARSKALRGGPPLPLERFARDARGLRIAGGVDFLLDYWTALAALDTGYGQPDEPAAAAELPPVDDAALSPRCREHLAHVRSQSGELAALCRRLTAKYGKEELAEQEHQLVIAGQIGGTLMGMAVVLARAAHLAERGTTVALEMADISCTDATRQLAGLWPQLAGDDPEPDYAAMSERVLRGDSVDFLYDGVITDVPPSGVITERRRAR